MSHRILTLISSICCFLLLASCSQETNWLRVEGNHIVNAKGETFIPRGLCMADPCRLIEDGHWEYDYFLQARIWGANCVRFAVHPGSLNKTGWERAFQAMDEGIEWAKQLDMYVIMDFHSIGNLRTEQFTGKAYETTLEETYKFWRTVAERYKDEPCVAFYELFNEPTVTAPGVGECTWTQWRQIQEGLIDAIREINPRALCLCAGFNWAYDLTVVADEPVRRDNIAYVSHPYPMEREQPWEEKWEEDYGFVADTYPVICTEIGFCLKGEKGEHVPVISTPEYGERITEYFEKKGIGFTAWCFDASWAPALFSDWDYTPTTQGRFFKAYLQKNNPYKH